MSVKKRGLGNGCTLYKKCGGCQLQNMTYDEQLHYKQVKVIKLLGKFCHVNEIIGMDEPMHYRCKVQAAFGINRGQIVSGVYQSSTHNIVPVTSCMIEDKTADSVIVTIRELVKRFKLGIFNENTLRGFLRHVLIRRGYYTNQLMVVMVTGSKVFPKKHDFINELLRLHPEITTVVQNVNSRFTNLVLSDDFTVLYGSGYIEDELCGCRFRISPASFYQVNPQQTGILYNTAINYMQLSGKETVIDAYCGTGTIGIIASKYAGKVIGIELNANAVEDAKINAKLNNAENTLFYCADAGKFMVDAAKADKRADAVIMDPPRAGSTVSFMRSVVSLSPKKVVYVSCNPETLARDLGYFVKNGYKVKKIQPVDMFPHTNHVECVVLLSKFQQTTKGYQKP